MRGLNVWILFLSIGITINFSTVEGEENGKEVEVDGTIRERRLKDREENGGEGDAVIRERRWNRCYSDGECGGTSKCKEDPIKPRDQYQTDPNTGCPVGWDCVKNPPTHCSKSDICKPPPVGEREGFCTLVYPKNG